MVSSMAGAAAAPEEATPWDGEALPGAPTGKGVMHCVQTVELGAVGDPQCGHFMSANCRGYRVTIYWLFSLSMGSLLGGLPMATPCLA